LIPVNASCSRSDRRRFLKAASALSVAAWIGGLEGCGSSDPIRIASHVWPGYEFMFLARSMGWLKPEDATLIETNNASESLAHLLAGKVQGAALTLDETLRVIQQGLSLCVVLLFDVSSGADALLVKSNIKSLSDLKGTRIGVETTAVGGLMLNKILAKAGLHLSDLDVVHVNIDDHLISWQNHDLDALITFEPIATKIEQLGALRLFDSREIPNTIFDVLAVRRDAAELFKRQLQALIGSHFRAQGAWKTNPIDTAYRLAKRLDADAGDIPMLFRGLQLPDLVYNRHMLGGTASELIELSKEVSALIEMNPSLIPADLFDATFLPKS
jgi:NitT/TauT family transport system substrate-binding protein